MRSFIRNNFASEHLKTYPNEAIWQAMNDTLNTLSRKGEQQQEELICSMTLTDSLAVSATGDFPAVATTAAGTLDRFKPMFPIRDSS